MHQVFKQTPNLWVVAIIYLFAALIPVRNADAQTALGRTDEYHTFPLYTDARSIALAASQVSEAVNASSMYNNPASLIFLSHPLRINANYIYNRNVNIIVENITFPIVAMRDHYLAGGATVRHGGLYQLGEPESPQLNFMHYEIDLGYAVALSPTLSAGMTAHGAFGKTASTSTWVSTSTAGVFYAPTPGISYGAVYRNIVLTNERFGAEIVYSNDFNGTTKVVRQKMYDRLELGATLRFPSFMRNPDIVVTFSNEKLLGRTGLIYKVGLEIFPLDFLAVRGGYIHGPTAVNGPRFGLGFLWDNFQFDYSLIPNQTGYAESHYVTFSVDLKTL